jgi:hypothetical protein
VGGRLWIEIFHRVAAGIPSVEEHGDTIGNHEDVV